MIAAATIGGSVAAPASQPDQPIDTSRSAITVHVFKAGLFRGFADNHEIRGAVKSGSVRNTLPVRANIVVDARDLRVLDPDAAPKDREQVRLRMLGPEVLDVNRFREIRFESTSGERTESGEWIVHGQLTLHGQSRPVATTITEDQGHFRGAMTLRQTDYGITPISVAGGTVKVKDELKIDFDIVTTPVTTTAQ
jgi:polyisoprenoid-binding protein YceI